MSDDATQLTHFVPTLRSLGVRVETPYVVRLADATTEFDAYLPDFGGPKGMLILLDGLEEFSKLTHVVEAAGCYFSALNGAAECTEESVKETLDDWGYYGPEELRPQWYTGRPRGGSPGR